MPKYIVKMQSIEKAFGGNKVLHGVDFCLQKGSVHALLGENGTGKTTLMNILGGVVPCNKGEIYINGRKAVINSPSDAEEYNIAFIHQEIMLVNDLRIYENLFLGNELKHGVTINKKAMINKAKNILNNMGIDLDPTALTSTLTTSYKQIVEIASALLKKAKIIIMDEPTASLNPTEIERIFMIMETLQTKGVSFVFISHKLNEVLRICDHFTVMRDGKVVISDRLTSDIDEHQLASYMVGAELSFYSAYSPRTVGNKILETRNLSYKKDFANINITLHKSEIIGVTGLLGDGRSELFSTIYGCNSEYEGEIIVNGQKENITSTVIAKNLGISYLPNNRKEKGIIKDLSISKNMSISILDKLKRLLIIDRKAELFSNQDFIRKLNIKLHNLNNSILSLSGGNQQKVILAKTLSSKPNILILDNPTQGVDIAAKFEIYNIIVKLAESGVGIVILSNEPQEILSLCDRIYVMYQGKIRKEFNRDEASQKKIMIIATGGAL